MPISFMHCNPESRSRHWRRRCPLLLWLTVCFTVSFQASGLEQKSAVQLAQTDANALVRIVSHNELANSYGYHASMRYRLQKITLHTNSTKEIVETHDGDVARLIAVDGKPLSASDEQKDRDRLTKLMADPALQEHRRREEDADAKRVNEIVRLLPSAFIYHLEEVVPSPNGPVIRLRFAPDPKFSPPTLESRMLTGVQGELWVDGRQQRLVLFHAHLFKEVSFGWGILGVLYPGGDLLLDQAPTGTTGWQLTRMKLDLHGRALFKHVQVVQDTTATGYELMPPNWSYRDAIRWLLKQSFSAAENTAADAAPVDSREKPGQP